MLVTLSKRGEAIACCSSLGLWAAISIGSTRLPSCSLAEQSSEPRELSSDACHSHKASGGQPEAKGNSSRSDLHAYGALPGTVLLKHSISYADQHASLVLLQEHMHSIPSPHQQQAPQTAMSMMTSSLK